MFTFGRGKGSERETGRGDQENAQSRYHAKSTVLLNGISRRR
jgi:hypothetical protein